MQSIDVKLKVVNSDIVKRIAVPESYEQLLKLSSSLVQNKPVNVTYVDSDGDNVQVLDDSDLNFAFKG